MLKKPFWRRLFEALANTEFSNVAFVSSPSKKHPNARPSFQETLEYLGVTSHVE
ncbi:hypothetical protein D3C75_1319940 [compost metagenome]